MEKQRAYDMHFREKVDKFLEGIENENQLAKMTKPSVLLNKIEERPKIKKERLLTSKNGKRKSNYQQRMMFKSKQCLKMTIEMLAQNLR